MCSTWSCILMRIWNRNSIFTHKLTTKIYKISGYLFRDEVSEPQTGGKVLKELEEEEEKIVLLILATTRVGYSRGTWEHGFQEILGPKAKYLAGVTPFSWYIQEKEVTWNDFLSKGIFPFEYKLFSDKGILPCEKKVFLSNELFKVHYNEFLFMFKEIK